MRLAGEPHLPKLKILFCIDLASSEGSLPLTDLLIFAKDKVDHSEVLWIPVVWIKSMIRSFHSVPFVLELLLHCIPLQDFRNKFPEPSSKLVSIGGLQFQPDRLGSPFHIAGEMKPSDSAVISTETVRNPETTTRPKVTDPPPSRREIAPYQSGVHLEFLELGKRSCKVAKVLVSVRPCHQRLGTLGAYKGIKPPFTWSRFPDRSCPSRRWRALLI